MTDLDDIYQAITTIHMFQDETVVRLRELVALIKKTNKELDRIRMGLEKGGQATPSRRR